MRTTFRRTAAALAMLVPLVGWQAANERLALQPESRLWVEGTSTIRSWSCTAADVAATVEAKGAGAIPQLLMGDKAVAAVDVKVPAEKLDCGNGTMNDHMRKALKVSEFPGIAFHLTSYDLARASDGITGTISGTLTLGGVQKPVSIPATGKAEGDALRVTGATDLKMTDYGLTPPSLMFGRIKVRETVNVKFDLLLKS